MSAPVGDVAPSGMLAEAPLRATHFRPEERSWGELQPEALRASEGTRARLYLLIQASQPELSDDEAWRTATRQAYDDLAARCPDGSIVPSTHPWDVEYKRQVRIIRAERDVALAGLDQILESGDREAYKAALVTAPEGYTGLAMFNRGVAATNRIINLGLPRPDAPSGLQAVKAHAEGAARAVAGTVGRFILRIAMLGSELSVPANDEQAVATAAPHIQGATTYTEQRILPVLTPPQQERPQIARRDIPAAMAAFRQHVADVKATHVTRATLTALPDQVVAAGALYDETYWDTVSALDDERTKLRLAQLDRAHRGDWASIDMLRARIADRGLSYDGIIAQAARAAFFIVSSQFSHDVLARAGIEPVGVDFPKPVA